MSEKTLSSFIQDLLFQELLNCDNCFRLCEVPSRLVENVGNVCNTCYSMNSETNNWTGIPNTLLDTILTTVNIPCKFQYSGCSMMLEYGKLKLHEQECSYRTISCVFFNTNICDWNGLHTNYTDHLIKDHSCSIVNSDNELDEFRFKINFANLIEGSSLIKILKSIEDTFIVKIDKRVEDGSYLIYKIYHFLDLLECPICKIGMRTPIYMCNSGHSICMVCKPKMTCCPICQASMGNSRNYSLESFSEKFKYECMHKCGKRFAGH